MDQMQHNYGPFLLTVAVTLRVLAESEQALPLKEGEVKLGEAGMMGILSIA